MCCLSDARKNRPHIQEFYLPPRSTFSPKVANSVYSWRIMIRQLQRVKAFGSFDNFTWPTGLHEFKKFNLIFGWNYSGKTTFTRALRCFELNKYHEDFTSAEVQFC